MTDIPENRSFYRLAEKNPGVAICFMHVLIERCGGAVRITKEELDQLDGANLNNLIVIDMDEGAETAVVVAEPILKS